MAGRPRQRGGARDRWDRARGAWRERRCRRREARSRRFAPPLDWSVGLNRRDRRPFHRFRPALRGFHGLVQWSGSALRRFRRQCRQDWRSLRRFRPRVRLPSRLLRRFAGLLEWLGRPSDEFEGPPRRGCFLLLRKRSSPRRTPRPLALGRSAYFGMSRTTVPSPGLVQYALLSSRAKKSAWFRSSAMVAGLPPARGAFMSDSPAPPLPSIQ